MIRLALMALAVLATAASAQVTAHRGASAAHPENTLRAFRAGIAAGADWLECDVFTTGDGELVVIHDATTGRVADRTLRVGETTLAELRTLDVATAHREATRQDPEACPPARVPTLREVLELVRDHDDVRLSIQPKDGSTLAACALVAELGLETRVGFNDGDLTKMTLARERLPRATIFWDRPADLDLARDLETAVERGFDALVLNDAGVTRARIAAIQNAGLAAGAWTVNDPARIAELFALGIDRVYTDFPDAAAAILDEQARLAAVVDRALLDTGNPSLAVGIVRGERLAFARVAGRAAEGRSAEGRAAEDVPATLDTRYRIASISKVFTATLLAALAADGTAALDDRLIDHLPRPDGERLDVAPEVAAITLDQLASHSSGLPRMPPVPLPAKVLDPYGAPGPEVLLDGLTRTELPHAPPAPFAYSNFGAALLGLALATAADRPFDTLLEARVLEPLGMQDTAVLDPGPGTERLATGFLGPSPTRPAPPWHLGAFGPAGGVVTTVPDFARFVAAHLTARPDDTDGPLPGAILAPMRTERVSDEGPGRGAGLGWLRSRLADGTELVWHNGGLGGFTSLCVLEPANGVAYFVFSNRGHMPGPSPLEDVVARLRSAWRE